MINFPGIRTIGRCERLYRREKSVGSLATGVGRPSLFAVIDVEVEELR